MAIPKPIRNAAGSYIGESTLHMSWMPEGQQLDKGASKLHVDFDRHTKYATVTYTWHYKGEEQEGTIIIAADDKDEEAQMGWSDSWHQSGAVMHLAGTAKDGEVSCKGKYAAPPGPDWGWRITLAADGDKLTMKMFNATPEGEEEIGVEASYQRE